MSEEKLPEVPQPTEDESGGMPSPTDTVPSETPPTPAELPTGPSAESSPELPAALPATEESVAHKEAEPWTDIGTEGGVFRVPEVPPVKERPSPDPMTSDDDLDDKTYVPSEASSSTLTTPGDMETSPTTEREQFAARDEDVRRRQVAGLPALFVRPNVSPDSPSSGRSSLEGAAGSSGSMSGVTTPMDDLPSGPGSPTVSCPIPSPAEPPADPVAEPSESTLQGMAATLEDSAKRRREAFARTPDAAVIARTEDLTSPSAERPPTPPTFAEPAAPGAPHVPAMRPRVADASKLFLDLQSIGPGPAPPPVDVDFSPMEEGDDSNLPGSRTGSAAGVQQLPPQSKVPDSKPVSELKED
ncbi:unnamed protein product [Ixodes hexagonus]